MLRNIARAIIGFVPGMTRVMAAEDAGKTVTVAESFIFAGQDIAANATAAATTAAALPAAAAAALPESTRTFFKARRKDDVNAALSAAGASSTNSLSKSAQQVAEHAGAAGEESVPVTFSVGAKRKAEYQPEDQPNAKDSKQAEDQAQVFDPKREEELEKLNALKQKYGI